MARAEPEPEVVEAKTIGVRHIYTSWLVDRFKKAIDDDHEVVTWDDLTVLLGERAQDHRSKIDTARKVVLREHRVRFQAAPGVGYRRANDQDVLGEVTAKRRAIARSSTRALELNHYGVDPEKLSTADRTRYLVEQSVLMMTRKIATDKSHQAVAARTKPTSVRLSIEDVYQAMK